MRSVFSASGVVAAEFVHVWPAVAVDWARKSFIQFIPCLSPLQYTSALLGVDID